MEFSVKDLRDLLQTNKDLRDKDLRDLLQTNKDVRDLLQTNDDGPWVVGRWYLIRTVTMIVTGRLKSIGTKELLLEDACWIADAGRFADCLKDAGAVQEAEPFVHDAIIGRGAIVDATEWLSVQLPQI